MTIDEAIAHAREVAKNKMAEYQNHYDKDAHYYPRQCKKCAEEHEQLAEWLEELKALSLEHKMPKTNEAIARHVGYETGYNKAIDDFVNACKDNVLCKTFGLRENDIEQIAEQLKAGGENE